MKTIFEEVRISTNERVTLIDITDEVEDAVKKSKIAKGFCLVQSLHSTTAIIVNEHEEGLMKDIVRKVQEEFLKGAGWFRDRIDDNADAHLASSFLSSSKVFAVRDGRVLRGTWQNIFLFELDGPRVRDIIVEVLGE